MKKIIVLILIAALFLMSGCSAETPSDNGNNTEINNNTQNEEKHIPVEIKDSPDKYTAYIKDYVGRNCATVGYESMGGDRNDYLGKGYIHLVMITESGEYVGVEDDGLKQYVVVAQNLEPNTEVKFTFEKDSEGEEYDNLIEWQSVDEVVLKVKKVGSKEKTTDQGMTAIKTSPDKYTAYLKDYVGRNLAMCGYISWGGELRDEYGDDSIRLNIITDDGSYFDLSDDNIMEVLQRYIVTAQSASPNAEIRFEYEKDSNGEEYSWSSWQSREEIDLYVELIE